MNKKDGAPGEDGGLIFQKLRKFINVIDELRDVGLDKVVSLPRICVLGGQSAGKSSVLESIVGIDFLPRGDGVVTRRPLEMRLNHSRTKIKPWAKFDELPDKKFDNFDQVKATIEMLTDKVCGQDKNIVDKPIILHIYSHTCPDLTLVDLPGITRIPIAGQVKNIEQVTKEMCRRYCGDPMAIVLCVLPANADMTTSDGLQMARELDPPGVRTVGVITKIDIMDRGTDAKSMLDGTVVPLLHGYVGIKNRSQQDIKDRITVEDAIAKEKEYFNSHKIYVGMDQSLLGVGNLCNKLTKILFFHIKRNLPAIIKDIREKTKKIEDELSQLGVPMPSKTEEKMQMLWGMITDFVQTYKNTIAGRYDARRYIGAQHGKAGDPLTGGAKIKEAFHRLYDDMKDFRATSEYTNEHVETAIQMHEGDGLPGFPSVDVFIYLINPQLERLRDPALELIQDTYINLDQIAQQIVQRIFNRFPGMQGEIMDIVTRTLHTERDKTRIIVEAIIDSEQNYLFTNDMNYRNNRQNVIVEGAPGQGRNAPQDSQNVFVQQLRHKIDDYFALVQRNVKDSIPKAIGYFLVRKSQEKVQMELYNQVQNNKALSATLGEPATITEKREFLTTRLNLLRNAMKVLQRDPDIINSVGDAEMEAALRNAGGRRPPGGPGHPNVGGQRPMQGGGQGQMRPQPGVGGMPGQPGVGGQQQMRQGGPPQGQFPPGHPQAQRPQMGGGQGAPMRQGAPQGGQPGAPMRGPGGGFDPLRK